MIRFLIMIVLTVLFLIFETTVEPYFFHRILTWVDASTLDHIRVNLFIIVVMILAIHREPLEGAIQSAIVGYLMDLFYLGMFGINTFLAISLYIIVKLILGIIQSEKVSHIILYTGLFSVMEGGMRLILFIIFSRHVDGYYLLWMVNTLLTMAVSPLVFKFFEWVDSLFESAIPGSHELGLSVKR